MLQQVPSKTGFRVIKQLLEAVTFEKLLPFDLKMLSGNEVSVNIHGQKYNFQSQGIHSSFGRIRLREETIRFIGNDGEQTIPNLLDIVNELTTNKRIKKCLMEELQQTICLGDWNEVNIQPVSRRGIVYEEMESALIEGHPYHPCFKARTGFSLNDHQMYGPEASGSFQLRWIAVKKEYIKSSFPCKEEQFMKEEIGEETYEELVDRLKKEGVRHDNYSIIPVHPWQWENMIIHEVKRFYHKEIIYLGIAGDFYRATQSVRTIWNITDPSKAHLKLPLNMVNTSSLRLMESNSVCVAPALSSWLVQVIEADSYLNDKLTVLSEYAGMVAMEDDMNLSGHLAALWRESPKIYLNGEEEAIPLNTLSLVEEDNSLYIQPWIDNFGLEKWMDQLVKVTIIPVWHLLVSEGLALEAHAQNMILVHEHGWPKRIIMRDFHESLEYVEGFLKHPELVPDFSTLHQSYKEAPSDKYYWMSSIEALRELVMDTLFVFHFSELSYKLSLHLDYPETSFWQLIRKAIHSHIQSHPELEERHNLLKSEKKAIYAESLFTRKIGINEKAFRHQVPNSLYHVKELT
ncbi:siderophore biosynthesis protein [Sutcliffiella horikoshii]|uniref:IucA/IucC family protein n=1 Tax=Sutcliffiella horikoshii TaxID=79883 RepID=UPI00203A855F|nr:IucA/IucC family protein [Sutcliffiella horikoshii]MCM3616041.1 siderophore biosynthesis protein [Sutcliffiella horikoshii]